MQRGSYNNFALDRVIYGEPAVETLVSEVRKLDARRVFLLASEPLATGTPWVREIEEALGDRHVGTSTDMPQHTPRDAVLRVAAQARPGRPDLIVTFGGGSVIDGGKMVRLALEHDIRTVEQFDPFVIRVLPDGSRASNDYRGPAIAQIAIPTTLGGGDFNPSAGSTDPRTMHKEIFIQRLLTPRIVILDPAVTVATPQWLFLSTGVRALDHAVETVCSPAAGPRSWLESLEAIRLLVTALPMVRDDSASLDPRMDAMLATWLSMERNRFGLTMGASHGIGHVLGGTFDVPHGYTSCVMLSAVLRWNEPANPDRQRRISEAFGQPDRTAATLVAEFVQQLGLPGSLREVGIARESFQHIAETSMIDHCMYHNPRPIAGPADVMQILELAE